MTPAPVVDAHVHFWEPGRLEYPWLAEIPALRRAFLPGDHAVACGRAPVEQLVFVEAKCRADQALREAGWIQELASQDPRTAAIGRC